MPSLRKRDSTWMARWSRNGRQYTECGFLSKKLAVKFEKRIRKLSKKKFESWWKEKHALKETDKKERMLALSQPGYFKKYNDAAAAKAKDVKVGKLTLAHIDSFEKEREEAGVTTETLSPKLLPHYAREVS